MSAVLVYACCAALVGARVALCQDITTHGRGDLTWLQVLEPATESATSACGAIALVQKYSLLARLGCINVVLSCRMLIIAAAEAAWLTLFIFRMARSLDLMPSRKPGSGSVKVMGEASSW